MGTLTAKVELLTESEVEMIHTSSLRILERVGLRLPNRECLTACERQGAIVDRDAQVFRIPSAVMESLLGELKASLPEPPTPYRPGRLQGHVSTQVYYVDYGTKTRRLGLLEDNLRGIAVLEQLENIAGCGAVVVPSDVPDYLSDVLTYQQVFKYGRRPGGTYVLSPLSARHIIEMHNVLGRRSSYLFATVSPLRYSKESAEIALVFAHRGMDLSIGPMVIGGVSGPVTVAGLITLQNAEMLASILVVYGLTERFPTFNAGSHSMDVRTMLCSFGSPNQALIGMATAQMARFYGYSGAWTNSGLTDALLPDFQCGVEKGLGAVFGLLGGTTNIGCQGIVGADQGISLEQLVLDNEWIAAYNHVVRGIEVTEETVAADLIEQVGIGGVYADREHTVRHMRQSYWTSRHFGREAWDGWVTSGAPSAYDRAHRFVQEAVREHYPSEPVLDPRLAAQIDEIAREAVSELTREHGQR